MEDFVKKIFEIDDEAEKYERSFEDKKKQLVIERQNQIKKIDKEYEDTINAEKKNLNMELEKMEKDDSKRLENFKKKAEDIKKIFEQKKDKLVEEFADSLL